MLDQPATGWTKDRTAVLRKMWAEGASAREIAIELGGGVTRAAVIGKVQRLKLERRIMPARDMGQAQRKAATARNAQPEPDPEGVKLLSTEVWNPLPGTEPVALEHVTGCRWPLGNIEDGTFCMCNAPRVENSSYCATHKRASEPKRP